ncbi:MAG: hypothetical protein GX483_01805 [Actinomycetaceae bacterium]|nr:hypothetical protein [Actinomycetaceae bacterium]
MADGLGRISTRINVATQLEFGVVPELPFNAVREPAANAIVHCDLGPDTVEAGKDINISLERTKLMTDANEKPHHRRRRRGSTSDDAGAGRLQDSVLR